MKKKAVGFGLLEIVLALAVTATILMVGFHYYLRAQVRSQLLQATAQIKRITEAGYAWRTATRQSIATLGGNNRMMDLVSAGMLVSSDQATPWGGHVTLVGNAQGQWVVKLMGLPKESCALLERRFTSLDSDGEFACHDEGKGEDAGEIQTWEGKF